MDSESWVIATSSGSYWGKSWGADGVTYVKANAYHYPSREHASKQIAVLVADGDARSYHVEELPPGRRPRY